MTAGENKFSTHVLELVRNNGKPSMRSNGKRNFLMFDYFDLLVHEELKGDQKVYTNYFSIGDTFDDDKDYKVSYKTLSLYCKSGSDKNPFVIKENEEAVLSEIPFLGLIQISLCKENYERKPEKRNQQIVVDDFLVECENQILTMVRDTNCFRNDDFTILQLYRCSTTGDFCLAMRTDSVEKIYGVALALNDSQNDPTAPLKVLTFTNVGLETKVLSDDTYGTLGQEFIDSHANMEFALRFSADSGLLSILAQYNKYAVQDKLEVAKGLFGRYDYLLHIDLREFSEIYPMLCERKFGTLREKSGLCQQNDSVLKKILGYPCIRNINERILVELKPKLQEQKVIERGENDWDGKITERNEKLYKDIMHLSIWRRYFAEEDRSFRDLHRGMTGIYKTFSAIGMEKEAYLNWLMFCQDMEMLCGCLESRLQKYEEMSKSDFMDEMQKKSYRLRLLKDWRINIQAINQYTRLVQNINYQTYQSPIYEIQTQIDTEKTMIAYRQAMMSYMDSYIGCNALWNGDAVPIIPIIYPDLSKDKVEVTAPFINQKKNNDNVKRAIMCTVPSFEYFGRLYDLLPWLLHESSHHLRILEREQRNRFFAEYVLSYIYSVVLEDALPELANDSVYRTIGRSEQYLVDSLVKVTMKDLLDRKEMRDGKEYTFAEFNFEKMIGEIEDYLKKLFSSNGYGEIKRGYDAEEIRNKAFQFYLSEYRKGGVLEEKYLEMILNIKRDKPVEEDARRKLANERDELAGGLLVRYAARLNAAEGRKLRKNRFIQLEDLKRAQEWFEKRLLEVDRGLLKANISKDAIKEYHFSVIELYRIAYTFETISQNDVFENKNAQQYFKRVYACYQEQECEKEDVLFRDPGAMYVLRRLGLLNGEEEVFCAQMQTIFNKMDYREIEKYKELRTIVYREAFSDLLMVTSLNINSFGYCRQVLQTISDARVEEKGYWYDDINNQRFRIVTAVLLEEELRSSFSEPEHKILIDEKINRIGLDATQIIEKGVTYCEYTLKCICGKLMEAEDVKREEDKKEAALYFLEDVKSQLECFLRQKGGDETYKSTYLYILLHGKKTADPQIVALWNEYGYDKIATACEPVKYIFLRLECFCFGMKNIIQDEQVIVPLNIFNHMKEIREIIRKKDGKGGCCWENDWDCLAEPKMDVGKFFNEPMLVYEKKSYQKLENTIDFIQNYYYYNRFKMMEEGEQDGHRE